jgi:hypothetical protein
VNIFFFRIKLTHFIISLIADLHLLKNAMAFIILTASLGLVLIIIYQLFSTLFYSPLARIPGPKSFALTKWRLAYEDYKGTRTRTIHSLHKVYGPVVRVGPNEVSFSSTAALRAIYGAGSGFERTSFYSMFQVYGRKNMFSFAAAKDHAARKKIISSAYAKSAMLKGPNAAVIEEKVRLYLKLLERDGQEKEVFSSLHYFSMDTVTQFLYGDVGKTSCLEGIQRDRALIEDVVDPGRRKLAWFTIHLPRFTNWLYAKKGLAGCLARPFYPMSLPTTYTGIRHHALRACEAFALADPDKTLHEQPSALIAKLWKQHRSMREDSALDNADVASECADHLLAGIETTSGTLMFLIWSLSRPENSYIRERLMSEVRAMPSDALNEDGIPRVDASDKLEYVNAVIKETLRLYAPLPGSEPRSLPVNAMIDGYVIPPRTIVSMSPYVLHRNPEVFKEPLRFNPDRWLDPANDIPTMNRSFWAFSSGARMCIGVQ